MSYPDPRYLGDKGEISARYRPANQEADLRIGSGTAMHYLATGVSTNGQFGLYRWEMPPQGPGPSAHFHRTMSESFFILSGTVHLFNGERWIHATPGDFLYVPEGGVHAFRNESSEPASMLILFAPGAPREAYFEALAEIAAGRKFSEEEWADICLRHDNYFIDPRSQSLYRKLLLNKPNKKQK
jgi:mannose-6-phosphate isomerase-like protein (cupin superfamily)